MNCRRPLARRALAFSRYLSIRLSLFILTLFVASLATAQAQTTTTLVPSSYTTTSGTDGGQAVATSIDILDESGTTNTWAKYVEFQTTASASYAGYRVYTLPTSIAPSSITGIQIKANYQGPDTSTQTWTWMIYNWSTSSYTAVGTNSGAPSWGTWKLLAFTVSGTLANYVRTSDGQIRVQLVSNNHADNADIDYEAVVVTSGATAVSVSVSPSTASVPVTQIQQFTATVTGSTNTAVTWQVNGVTSGNSTTGTISTSGLYTAPATVPSPAAVTIKAISQADTTKSATATATVTAAATVGVSVSPTTASVQTVATQQFTATVTGTSNTAVTWQVNGVTGGNSSTTGTVSSTGLYTAPASVPSPPTVTVTAVSQADTTKSASATVTVFAPSGGGVTYYVSNSGNDSNSGTITSPWKTIQHAATSLHAGDTAYVRAGTYNELVTIGVSGSASGGYITFANYPGESPIIDGTGLSIPNNQNGLVTIQNQNYVIVQGFEIRNYSTSSTANVPIGIFVTGSGSFIKILNNHIHNIVTSASGCTANALGLAVYGSTSTASINNLTIDHNELNTLTTGCSESLTINGNVQTWSVTNNLIHDNNNIGIDAIGYEGTATPKGAMCGSDLCDRARDGNISGNTIYNITSNFNPAYGAVGSGGAGNASYGANGIYVDGGTRIVIERNIVHNVDLGIQAASENPGKQAAGVEKSDFVTIRSNLVYSNNAVGITIGGYANSGAGGGGSDNILIVNNSLYNNDTAATGQGEFQVQYHATNSSFNNNIIYANSQNIFINYVSTSTASPGTVDYNLYYAAAGANSGIWQWRNQSYTGFTTYQSGSGNDAHSLFANPLYSSLTTPDFHVASTSPAVNAGTNLGTTIEGTLDFAGNARVQGPNIDIGAYEQ